MSAILTQPEQQAGPGLRERQREARDEAILEAAYALMEDKGYDAMTMDELAERAGISKRTLYHHFPSKEAIAVRTVVMVIATSEEYLRTANSHLEPMARLESMLRWLVRMKLDPPTGPLAYVRTQPTVMSAVRSNPEYRAALHTYIEALAALIRAAQAAGEVDPALDAFVVAHALFGMVRGAEFEEMSAGGLPIDTIADMLVGMLMRGIRAQSSANIERAENE